MKVLHTVLMAAGAWALWQSRPGDDLSGEVALVTGGSRGLGFLLARRLLEQGCTVVICGRDAERLEAASERLAGKGRLDAHVCDVSDRDAVQRLVARIHEDHGSIDVLVNNAAIIQVGPLESLGHDDFERVMATNFWGAYNTTRAVLPAMRERGHGRIANVASIGGRVAVPHLLPYDSAKFAMIGFSEGLRAELSGTGVNVLTVVPGLMRTGSPIEVPLKGDHAAELAWFAAGDVLPFTSMSAERAAGRIVKAIRRDEAQVTLSWQAKLLEAAHGVAPAAVTGAMALANRLLPESPDTPAARRTRRGREVFGALPTHWLRSRLLELGRRTNQPVDGLTP